MFHPLKLLYEFAFSHLKCSITAYLPVNLSFSFTTPSLSWPTWADPGAISLMAHTVSHPSPPLMMRSLKPLWQMRNLRLTEIVVWGSEVSNDWSTGTVFILVTPTLREVPGIEQVFSEYLRKVERKIHILHVRLKWFLLEDSRWSY